MVPRRGRLRLAVVFAAIALGCGSSDGAVAPTSTAVEPTTTAVVPTGSGGPASEPGGPGASGSSAVVPIALRVESLVADVATDELREAVAATLLDPRGWTRAGFTFTFDDPAAPYHLVLAEGDEVDRRCTPYDTFGRYSCQLGATVALNADRWRTATPEWTGDLATYRQMLVNHEVGHLLGQHHPAVQCPAPGQPAPVMAQQSTELEGCLPNPWPLDWEVSCAARHDEPLAPAYEPDAEPSCTAAG